MDNDNISINEQKAFLSLINKYNNIKDKTIIKTRLNKAIEDFKGISKYKYKDIAEQLNLSTHTIYKITKTQVQYNLDFTTTLNICCYLDISISDLLDIPETV